MADWQTLAATEPKGLRVAVGVIFLVLGLVALIWPKATLLVVAVIFGLQLIVVGLLRVIAAVALKEVPQRWRAVSGILGALTVVAGIIFLFRPGTSLGVLVLVLAIGWIIDGVSELISAFAVPRRPAERGTRIMFGVLGIIAAVVVLIYPGESLVLLARTGGVILIALGVVSLLTAWAGRRAQPAGPATGLA